MVDYQKFKTYTTHLYQIDNEYDATQTDRLARYRHLEPESAQFLASLIISNHASNVLEIGTSTGYSTLWLAYALQTINFPSQFVSIDIDNDRLLQAKEHLAKLNLLKKPTSKD